MRQRIVFAVGILLGGLSTHLFLFRMLTVKAQSPPTQTWFTEGLKVAPAQGTIMAKIGPIGQTQALVLGGFCSGGMAGMYLLEQVDGSGNVVNGGKQVQIYAHGALSQSPQGGWPTWETVTLGTGESIQIVTALPASSMSGTYSCGLHLSPDVFLNN
jgi:hypothetical protein